MDTDLNNVLHCAGVVGSFVAKSLVRLLAGAGGAVSSPNQLVSLQKAVEMLDIGESTLRQYVREGKIKPIRLDNGRLRFEQSELVRFQAQRISEKS